MANTIGNGSEWMLFVGSGSSVASIACATSCNLNQSNEMKDTSHKDVVGDWSTSMPHKKSWQATTDNMFSIDPAGQGYFYLKSKFDNSELVHLYFAKKTSATLDNTKGWTPAINTIGDTYMQGDAYINSMDMTAPVDDNATFSVNFTGFGPLSMTTVAN